MARVILEEGLYDAEFLRRWVNWEAYLEKKSPARTFDDFIAALKAEYARFTPQYAEAETGVPAATIVEVFGKAPPKP